MRLQIRDLEVSSKWRNIVLEEKDAGSKGEKEIIRKRKQKRRLRKQYGETEENEENNNDGVLERDEFVNGSVAF